MKSWWADLEEKQSFHQFKRADAHIRNHAVRAVCFPEGT